MPREIRQEITVLDKTQAAFRSVNRSVKSLQAAFVGLGASLSIGGITAFVKSQVDAADKIGKLSTQIGASTEALSEYQFVAEQTGVEFDTLTMAWQRMTRRISQAAQGSGEAVEALSELGLSAKALNKLRPEDQFEAIAKAMEGVTNEGDRVRIAFKLFDSEGVRLLRTLDQGAEGMGRLREEARALGLTLTQADTERAALFADTWNRIKSAFSAAFRAVAFQLLPTFQELASYLQTNLVPAIRAFGESWGFLKPQARVIEELRQKVEGLGRGLDATRTAQQKLLAAGQVDQANALKASIEGQEKALADAQYQLALAKGDTAALSQRNEQLRQKYEALIGPTERASTAIKKTAEAAKEAADDTSTAALALELIDAEFKKLDADAARAFAGLEKPAEKTADKFDELKSSIDGWGKSFADAMIDATSNFNDFVENFLRQLARIAITQATQPFFDAFGSFVADMFRASGGPVKPNMPYVVGEQGPEVFVPSSSGTIIPNDKLSSGGGSAVGGVTVNLIESPGNGGRTAQRQEGGQFVLDIFVEQIRDAMVRDIRSGGKLAGAMSSQFGLNRAAGAY